MGWAELPAEKDAPKRAAEAVRRMPIGNRPAKARAENLVAQWRTIAEHPCTLCTKPIGWARRFYCTEGAKGFSHATCVEDEVERERRKAQEEV